VREVLGREAHQIAPDLQARLEAGFNLVSLMRAHGGL